MPSFLIEDQLSPSENSIVVGIDEVGYGAIAGPVVAAAVYIHNRELAYIGEIKDSKKLSPKKRISLYAEITRSAAYGIGYASVEEIEEYNILVASHIAMRRALVDLDLQPDLVLVDGIRSPDLQWPCETIVSGDDISTTIAAASIVAKVTRDRMMSELGEQHPEYSWSKNKGYGTKEHILSVRLHGETPHHRRTFAPLKANKPEKKEDEYTHIL
ncbi:ribonuclease HII [Anaplasma bovis]|uniref:ribonuclease HII n=1 Tax=Anaplasma bovis TaxID=186733 RepID=UPI002FF124E6